MIVGRRRFLALLSCQVLSAICFAETTSSAVLRELVAILRQTGRAVSVISDGIGSLVSRDDPSLNTETAKRARDRLLDISRRLARLIAQQNVRVVQSLDDYIDEPDRSNADWRRVLENLRATLQSVKELLDDIQVEKSEFVLEPAYLEINKTLSARSSILAKLLSMTEPTSPEEIDILREASAEYRILIGNAEAALVKMNAYLKESNSSEPR